MTHRPLTPLEVDTLRVALALLREIPPSCAELEVARETTDVHTIASDAQITRLLDELTVGEVGIRRRGGA